MAYDPFDINTQKEESDKKQKEAELRIAEEEADLRWMMSSKKGRRFIYRMLEASGVFQLSFNPNALQMAFKEGNRNFGNRILSQVMIVCPEQFHPMLKENKNDRTSTD